MPILFYEWQLSLISRWATIEKKKKNTKFEVKFRMCFRLITEDNRQSVFRKLILFFVLHSKHNCTSKIYSENLRSRLHTCFFPMSNCYNYKLFLQNVSHQWQKNAKRDKKSLLFRRALHLHKSRIGKKTY